MRVLYREEGELILKKVEVLTVTGSRVLLESLTGDTRVHVIPHPTWTTEALESVVRAQAREEIIDLEPLSLPQ